MATRKLREGEKRLISTDYHRNGIAGEGFDVTLFTFADGGKEKTMLGVVFPLERGQTWNGRVAVFELDKLTERRIEFGVNSWRGDNFEGWLRRKGK